MKRKLLIPVGAAWFVCLLTGCFDCGRSTSHIPAVTDFDPVRYAGVWHEIARLPRWFERDMRNVQAEYTLRPDGRIDVVNRGTKNGRKKEIRGTARKREGFPPSLGELEVSFFGPFYSPYRIIHLDRDHTVAVVTSGTMDCFWILSRSPELPEETLRELLEKAEEWGFPVDRMEYPGHTGSD